MVPWYCSLLKNISKSQSTLLVNTLSHAAGNGKHANCVTHIHLYPHSLIDCSFMFYLFVGIAGLFTIFSSFVFSTAVVNLAGSDLTGLK